MLSPHSMRVWRLALLSRLIRRTRRRLARVSRRLHQQVQRLHLVQQALEEFPPGCQPVEDPLGAAGGDQGDADLVAAADSGDSPVTTTIVHAPTFEGPQEESPSGSAETKGQALPAYDGMLRPGCQPE